MAGRADGETTGDTADAGMRAALRVVGSVTAQTTLIGTLLFYFGWARTQAALGYFGISPAIANLSASDYVLRSIDVVIRPLVVLGLLALALLAGHRRLATMLAVRPDPEFARRVMVACVAVGLALCLLGLLGLVNWVTYSPTYPYVPILLAAGVTLTGYGTAAIPRPPRPGGPAPRRRAGRAQLAVAAALDVALVFWVVAVYANITGEHAAAGVAGSLGRQPSVVVYSQQPLHISAPRVRERQFAGGGYRYRYSGLTLLLYSDGQYFLLPAGWQRGRDPVLLIRTDPGIRVEFYTGS